MILLVWAPIARRKAHLERWHVEEFEELEDGLRRQVELEYGKVKVRTILALKAELALQVPSIKVHLDIKTYELQLTGREENK